MSLFKQKLDTSLFMSWQHWPVLLPWAVLVVGVFLPRLFDLDIFFIQDEQPWLNRSQLYTNALGAGDFEGATRYPLSNHPAIMLMSVVGPTLNTYAKLYSLTGTYESWPLDHKRLAAAWARRVWGMANSFLLLALYFVARRLPLFRKHSWWAVLFVILLGLEPWIWGITRTVSVDVMMALALVGSFITSAVARSEKRPWWFVLAGIWWAVAFLSKSPALITAPFILGVAILLSARQWKESMRRAGLWLLGAGVAMTLLWPPLVIHPFERLTDVLARAELHSSVPEEYLWPGIHPPLFIFTLSTFAFIGCVLYILFRLLTPRSSSWELYRVFDVMLIAGLFHGAVLLYLQGDHARKNLPVIALLAAVGIVGWLCTLKHLKSNTLIVGLGLIVLQLAFVWPYFPHLITAHNVLFATPAARRLLVDVGNGSRLAADYINEQENVAVFATAMDSLIQPYLDYAHRSQLRGFPASGRLEDLDPAITDLIIPASFPARVNFDPVARHLLEELEAYQPVTILVLRHVPFFFVYRLAER